MSRSTGEYEPHAWRLRSGRRSSPWQVYFITKRVQNRLAILSNPVAAEIVIASLAHVRAEGSIKLLAFVVMPDHYHALFALAPGVDLSLLMRRIGSFTSNKIRKQRGLKHVVWQHDGFYDRACRDDREVLSLAEYTEHNPVRKNLVLTADESPFSSAHPSRRSILDWEWWL
jgi:REP element-mobilizing transposase RayT